MIQRIQSVWLFLAGTSLLVLWLVPLSTKIQGNSAFNVFVGGLYQSTNGVETRLESFLPLLIASLVIAFLCFAAVFLFRNRQLQKRLVLILAVLLLIFTVFCGVNAQKLPGGIEQASLGAGIFLPISSIVCCLLAYRGINNDERLIRSADRLR